MGRSLHLGTLRDGAASGPKPRAGFAGPILVLAVLAPLAMLSCGQKVLLGNTQPPEPDPDPFCQTAACGAECVIDSCPPGGGDCPTIALRGYCDPSTKVCVDDPPDCPPPLPFCAGRPCGTICEPDCAHSEPACDVFPGSYVCDGMGACVDGPIMCPCEGPNCMFEPCAGLPCGASCNPCGPMDPACPPPPLEMVCNIMGACVPNMGIMCPIPVNPCLMMPCGASCLLCPPNDPSCVEPPGPKFCNPMAQCVQGMFNCPGPDPGDAGTPDSGMPGP